MKKFGGRSNKWTRLALILGVYISPEVIATTLILILKTNEPRQLGYFRPISLGNFLG